MQLRDHQPVTAIWASTAALLTAVSLALTGCASPSPTLAGASTVSEAAAPVATGQRVVMATHSFNVFVGPVRSRDPNTPSSGPGPLAALAAERGKAGHETLAVQMIGGSTPMQHWNQGGGDDSKNIAKAALANGWVDVFTLSPNATMPEPGIDLFGDYVIRTNPNARILVQNSWSSWDGTGLTPAVGGTGNDAFQAEDHDRATSTTIDGWLASLETPGTGYLVLMRKQLDGINARAGRRMAYVVPSATSVYNLRKLIISGRVPGVAKQSELFRDGIGHPKAVPGPLANVVTYTWYATMYRESPVGLMALIDQSDPTSAARERLLQQIAWNAVVAEPMSGVRGRSVRIGS